MTNQELLEKFAAQFPRVGPSKVEVKGYVTLQLPAPADLVPVVKWLKGLGFEYLDIVTATDYKGPVDAKGFVIDPNPNAFAGEGGAKVEVPGAAAGFPYREAFELLYCLTHFGEKIKVFLKLEIGRQTPKVPSLTALFPTADYQEREAFDLLGVEFEGHPNLTKLLTPDFIQGHPLRKDYAHVADRFD